MIIVFNLLWILKNLSIKSKSISFLIDDKLGIFFMLAFFDFSSVNSENLIKSLLDK